MSATPMTSYNFLTIYGDMDTSICKIQAFNNKFIIYSKNDKNINDVKIFCIKQIHLEIQIFWV